MSNDDALIVVDPPEGGDSSSIRAFRASKRPVVTLRPMASTRPADLLIAAFDGLLAQLDDGCESIRLDEALLELLRQQSVIDLNRYEVWLRRALFNAALARIDDGQNQYACRLLAEAMELGSVPDELERNDRMDLAEALGMPNKSDGDDYEYWRRVQAWLLD